MAEDWSVLSFPKLGVSREDLDGIISELKEHVDPYITGSKYVTVRTVTTRRIVNILEILQKST